MTEQLCIQGKAEPLSIQRRLKCYLYRKRGGVTYTGDTKCYLYRKNEPLSIQGRGSVMYTGETEPLCIQERLKCCLYRGDEVSPK